MAWKIDFLRDSGPRFPNIPCAKCSMLTEYFQDVKIIFRCASRVWCHFREQGAESPFVGETAGNSPFQERGNWHLR